MIYRFKHSHSRDSFARARIAARGIAYQAPFFAIIYRFTCKTPQIITTITKKFYLFCDMPVRTLFYKIPAMQFLQSAHPFPIICIYISFFHVPTMGACTTCLT